MIFQFKKILSKITYLCPGLFPCICIYPCPCIFLCLQFVHPRSLAEAMMCLESIMFVSVFVFLLVFALVFALVFVIVFVISMLLATSSLSWPLARIRSPYCQTNHTSSLQHCIIHRLCPCYCSINSTIGSAFCSPLSLSQHH